jgi:hypothetical protein
MAWKKGMQNFIMKQGLKHLDEKAIEVRDTAKELAPVLSGALRDSIYVQKESKQNRRIGSDLPYAMSIEMGKRKKGPVKYLQGALRRVFK